MLEERSQNFNVQAKKFQEFQKLQNEYFNMTEGNIYIIGMSNEVIH